MNQKIEKHAESKLKFPKEPESVSKDKCYKLGKWLHGEYRDKLRKNAVHTERINKNATFREETKTRTINPKNSAEEEPHYLV
jgi:hypothetical protein